MVTLLLTISPSRSFPSVPLKLLTCLPCLPLFLSSPRFSRPPFTLPTPTKASVSRSAVWKRGLSEVSRRDKTAEFVRICCLFTFRRSVGGFSASRYRLIHHQLCLAFSRDVQVSGNSFPSLTQGRTASQQSSVLCSVTRSMAGITWVTLRECQGNQYTAHLGLA